MLRLFIGLDLPSSVKQELAAMASGVAEARWIAPENLHLTLRFIGDMEEGEAEELDILLQSVKAPSFSLALSGVGCFESRGRVRQIWAGVAKEPALESLHKKIEQALIGSGLKPEGRKFTPHVTLARLKGAPAMSAKSYLEYHAAFQTEVFEVNYFTLYQSHLSHKGATYQVLADYPLNSL